MHKILKLVLCGFALAESEKWVSEHQGTEGANAPDFCLLSTALSPNQNLIPKQSSTEQLTSLLLRWGGSWASAVSNGWKGRILDLVRISEGYGNLVGLTDTVLLCRISSKPLGRLNILLLVSKLENFWRSDPQSVFFNAHLDTISVQYLIPLDKAKDLWKQTVLPEQVTGL